MRQRLLALVLLPGLLVASTAPADDTAQRADPPPVETTIRDVLENEKRADDATRAARRDIDASGAVPRTPLQLVVLLREAVQNKDWGRAGSYLDRRYLPEALDGFTPAELVQALSTVWAQQNLVDITRLSDRPEGHLDDGLPAYRELLGVVRKDDGTKVPIYLQRIPDGDGGQLWKVSNATVKEIPALWDDLGYGPVAVWLQTHLPGYQLAGMQSWQLIAAALFLVASWYLAGLAAYLLMRLALLVPNGFPRAIEQFSRGSLKLFLFLFIFRWLMDQLALSLVARIYLNSSGLTYIAFSILLLGVISLVRDYHIRRLERLGNRQYVALLKPFTTIVKVLALTVIALIWADRAGYNISTIIAGLGVGSLAVALAAQKTLENVIGAITLYSAKPVNPGDLCRFGGVVGVVEEIGLRSTLIRTLDRSLLAVPNSVFASVEVENFSHRDRIRYFRHLELQLGSADQLRVILGRLHELFLSHANVLQETVSIRLESIVAANAVIRIDAGIDTTDYQHYLAVAEDLNLRSIELVHGAGAAFSGRVLQLRDTAPPDDELRAAADDQLASWASVGQGPFPDFTALEKSRLKGSIRLPATDNPTAPTTGSTR